MATYTFSKITAAEAKRFNILAYDTLVFTSGSATDVEIAFYPQSNGYGSYQVTMGTRSVFFPQAGVNFGLPAAAAADRIKFADGSHLFVGGAGDDFYEPSAVAPPTRRSLASPPIRVSAPEPPKAATAWVAATAEGS